MGFFKALFNQEQSPQTISKSDELKWKLKGMGIDFDKYWFIGGQDYELSIDDEVLGVTRKSYNDELESEGERFSSSISSEKKNGHKTLFLCKSKLIERDIKTFIDEITGVLGGDWLFRKEFDIRDLSVVRGERLDSDTETLYEGGVIREWKDILKNDYLVRVGFYKDDDDTLTLTLFMFFQ